jgi:4-amino-4-deoxy-L-arabinose transferase-like glycosyltransferase
VSVREGTGSPAALEPVETRGSSARTSRLLTALLPALLIIVVCAAAVVTHVADYQRLGPLDEQAHLDVVNRILAGSYPVLGDKLTTVTRHEVACRGIETPAGFGDRTDCHTFRRRVYPEHAFSYEATQPPLYYAVTAELSRITPGDGLDSIRRVGALWLSVGAVALYFTLRRFRAGIAVAMVLSLALALSPPLLFAASVVSNDVAVWAWGACGLLVVVALLQRPGLRWWHLLIGAAVGAVGAMTKPSALLIVMAFALAALLVQCWAGRWRGGVLLAGALVAGALLTTGAWGFVVNQVQHVPLQHVDPWRRYHIDSFDPVQLVKQPLFNLVTTQRAFVPTMWRLDWRLGVVVQIAVYVELGLLLIPLLSRTADRIGRSVGIAYLAAIAVSGPFYVLLYAFATHLLYGADARFAYGLIPMMAVVLIAWVQPRWQQWTLTTLLALPALMYLALVTDLVGPIRR